MEALVSLIFLCELCDLCGQQLFNKWGKVIKERGMRAE